LNLQRWNVFSMEPKAKKTKICLNKMFIVCRLWVALWSKLAKKGPKNNQTLAGRGGLSFFRNFDFWGQIWIQRVGVHLTWGGLVDIRKILHLGPPYWLQGSDVAWLHLSAVDYCSWQKRIVSTEIDLVSLESFTIRAIVFRCEYWAIRHGSVARNITPGWRDIPRGGTLKKQQLY